MSGWESFSVKKRQVDTKFVQKIVLPITSRSIFGTTFSAWFFFVIPIFYS